VLFNAFAQCSNTVLTIAVFASLLGHPFGKKLAVQLEKYFPKSRCLFFLLFFEKKLKTQRKFRSKPVTKEMTIV